jgi:heme exporter protein C
MESKPIGLKILDIVTIVLLLIATWMVFFYAPMEAVMGNVQRVFYFHVSAGWVGMLAFLVAAIAGVVDLVSKNTKWDNVEVRG